MSLTAVVEKKSIISHHMFDYCGVTELHEFLQLARIEPDPWGFVQGFLSEISELHEELFDENELEDFTTAVLSWLDQLDVANCARVPDRNKEVEPDRESYYSPWQLRRDVRGDGTVVAFVYDLAAQEIPSNSREIWQRTNRNQQVKQYNLSDYGTFSLSVTANNAASMLRVRRIKDQLSVGGILINLTTGVCKCHVSGCNWRRQLRWIDREYAEYQVLCILAHLGEHTMKNPKNYMNPILEVKRFRDSDNYKLKTWKAYRG